MESVATRKNAKRETRSPSLSGREKHPPLLLFSSSFFPLASNLLLACLLALSLSLFLSLLESNPNRHRAQKTKQNKQKLERGEGEKQTKCAATEVGGAEKQGGGEGKKREGASDGARGVENVGHFFSFFFFSFFEPFFLSLRVSQRGISLCESVRDLNNLTSRAQEFGKRSACCRSRGVIGSPKNDGIAEEKKRARRFPFSLFFFSSPSRGTFTLSV